MGVKGGGDAAVFAHLDQSRGVGMSKHAVFAGQGLDYPVDRRAYPEGGATFDTGERSPFSST